MQILKTKTMATIIAVILLTSMATMLAFQPTAKGEVINGINYNQATADAIKAGMRWDLNANASTIRLTLWNRYHDKIPTWVYSTISPNPVGVGQEFSMVIFNPQVPYQAQDTNSIRYRYHVEITKPDGAKERIPPSGSLVSDSTGTTYSKYSPDATGNYTVTVIFEQLDWLFPESIGSNTSSTTGTAGRDYYGVTFLSSNRTYTVTVQEDPVYPTAITYYPLPTEYWTRPIEGQMNTWGAVSSNWLNTATDRDYGSPNNRIQTQGTAPNSGHILWTKPTEDGGVVGGNAFLGEREGQVFNAGHQYQTRFSDTQIIMHGRVLYQEPILWAGTGGDWVCVDLKTGQEIWRNKTMSATPSFGMYVEYDDMNQHGVINPGYIWSNNFGAAIHPRYGTTRHTLNITDVPAGTIVAGPKGEQLRYILRNDGTTTSPIWRLYEWNSSRVFAYQVSGTFNASLASLIQVPSTAPNQPFLPTWDFNVTISTTYPSNWSPTIRQVKYGDYLLASNGTLPTAGTSALYYHNQDVGTLFAINLNASRGAVGSILWMKNYDMTYVNSNKETIQKLYIRAGEGVFILQEFPTLTFEGYDVYTGNKLWRSEPQADVNPFGYYSWVSLMNVYGTSIYDGKLITAGYTGHVFCYDLKTGELLWKQAALTGGEIFQYYTVFHGLTADGKVFIGTHEHSADTPLLKGAKVRVYNYTTGDVIWEMLGWAHPGTFALGDGVLTYWNNYDHQIYAVGKGPSSTTVSIANDVVPFGNSVMIKGTVTDVSPGTKQSVNPMRFPNGVPAVSDESQSAWMEYVYMQKPRPTNVTGVTVKLSVLDSNNNMRDIGTTVADADGFFSFNWKPDIPGKFTVYASFEGSESYWPSHATTAFNVDPAPEPTETSGPIISLPPTELYFVGSTIAIIVAIAIVGILLLRKKP
ncbi:MAG: PQQ-binding-like beta-propeller repeat protein [Candidatus Bathyarchaeota archaeon]|nr:PQQ-binding-like beta-propeller repeat protein [Candidatus Bathyarchaeota archaeon]